MKRLDPAMTSMFHMDWLVPLDPTTEDDYTRAVAEKAEALLASVRFMGAQRGATTLDMEVRVWVEAACANACVAITWEPGAGRYAFHLLDESLKERLGCVVFHAIPCVDAEESLGQADRILDAALFAMGKARKEDIADLVDAVRRSPETVRVPVQDARPETE